MKKKLSIFLVLCMFTAMMLGCSDSGNNEVPEESGQESAESLFTPGTYTAEAFGHNDYITVETKVDENKILDVKVIESYETKYIGDVALTRIPDQVVEYQTLNVDSVSGATVTSNAVKAAVKDTLEQSSADLAKLDGEVPELKPTGKEEVKTYDVVIIGAGGAGLTAAVEAYQNGAESVVVLEKMSDVGGNTVRSGGLYNSFDAPRQAKKTISSSEIDTIETALSAEAMNDEHAELIRKVQVDYDEYKAEGGTHLFDSPAWHALQTYASGDGTGEVTLIERFANNAYESLSWLENMGLDIDEEVNQATGALWQRSHQATNPAGIPFIDVLLENVTKAGADIFKETEAKELIVTDGRVTGVKALDPAGDTITFNANNGVIIASGGYGANVEMRMENNEQLTEDVPTTNFPEATGDGIIMAQEIGADVTGMDYVQVHPLATVGSGALNGRARRMGGVESILIVNKEGKRFVNEGERRDVLTAAILEQTDGVVYEINDSQIVEEVNQWGENVEMMIERGRVFKADTLEELAEMLDLPADDLVETVKTFNTYVDATKDLDFGRSLWAHKTEVGPFYGVPRSPSVHHTMGGLKIDTEAHVLNTDGEIIEGLFAAGEVTGGIHGSNRLGGNAITDITVFGRIAGTNVMK
ncbi:MAG: flavocytochrome c [Clostridium sp.]|nr:flavocytochrome c [Clostridium sp.]